MTNRCTNADIRELEYHMFERNSLAVMWCIRIVVATDAFWLIVGLADRRLLPNHRFESFSLLFAAIAFCVVLGCWSRNRIVQKRYLDLRRAIIALDTLLTVEVTILCVLHNLTFSQPSNTILFDIPLSSLYLFMFVFMPLVRFIDSVYIISLSTISIVIPCFSPGRENYNPLPDLVMLACIIVAYIAFRTLTMNSIRNEQRLKEQRKQYLRLTYESLETVAATIDAKNNYLKGHSKRVADFSRMIARRMGLSEEECRKVYFAGLLHDIGKIGIPNSILDKKQRLTDEEYAAIKRHSSLGSEILKNMRAVPELAPAARWHHERFDGSGYPDGIQGESIPLFARIISVCDAYDAMSSQRSYREPMPRADVLAELKRCRGTQFDPQILDIMLAMLEEENQG